MTTAATHHEQSHTTEATLFVAFELSEKTWKLGFTTGHGQKPRERTVTARSQERVLEEIAEAKRRLGLPETAPVVSCYEAVAKDSGCIGFYDPHLESLPSVGFRHVCLRSLRFRCRPRQTQSRACRALLAQWRFAGRHVASRRPGQIMVDRTRRRQRMRGLLSCCFDV